MADLNGDQFSKVFSGMDQMDQDHPTAAYTANKDATLYHGTTHVIRDGMVRPADAVDKNVSEYSMGDPGDMSEGDHAFATKDENYAWHAAGTFHKNGRRPRVYETGPAHDMVPGPWNKEHPDFLMHHGLDDPNDYDVANHPSDEAIEYGHLPKEPDRMGDMLESQHPENRRGGASLRAFMEGKPAPEHKDPTLF